MPGVPAESRASVNGVELALWEWPGCDPAILLCHATGFHGRIWDEIVARLDGHRCVAFDARGHGRSSKPAPPYPWRDFGADVAGLVDLLGLRGAIGVGHSQGGHAVTLASALRPSAFAALVLLDPVIRPQEGYYGLWGGTDFVRRRRNQWASAQEMFERFENRPPFDSWNREVLRDYCEHALCANGAGFVLACPPEVEASVYENSTALESNIYAEMAAVDIPVHVVRAGRYRDPEAVMRISPTAQDLAARFHRGVDTCLADHSHFIPMEAPELTAKLITDALALL